MFKLSTALLGILVPLSAAQAQTRTIVSDGTTIEYTSSVDADGVLHLEGRTGKGEDFRFRVSPGGRLTGHVADRTVNTRVSRATRERAVQSAARATPTVTRGTR